MFLPFLIYLAVHPYHFIPESGACININWSMELLKYYCDHLSEYKGLKLKNDPFFVIFRRFKFNFSLITSEKGIRILSVEY